ncbi:MAG: autotransporter outer membrane beta-barrel domain-containing protein [Oxalobacteraceae bacterium]|nr:MAG: autotransporter outer membrane beta-barrel domain-containing protein [Oxalobacteraceae bacterium]
MVGWEDPSAPLTLPNMPLHDPFMVAGRLDNDAKGRDSMVSAGIRTPLQVGGMTVEPFARVAYQKSRRDGFQENSATPAALQLSGYDASGTRVMAGLSGGSTVRDPLAGQTTLRYSVGVGRDSGSLVRPEVGASLAGVGTTILSPAIGRSFVQANAEATTGIGKMSYAYFGLAGEARSGKTDLGVTGGVRIRF